MEKAAAWALSCRNADGGFGHFPGSTSDADACYFHVGTLVMAGVLKPADPAADAHLLGWGHLFPVEVRCGRSGGSTARPTVGRRWWARKARRPTLNSTLQRRLRSLHQARVPVPEPFSQNTLAAR